LYDEPISELIADSLASRGYSDPAACPEDAVISDVVRASGGNIVFQDYQALAANVRCIHDFVKGDRSGASVLHFEGREKSRMKEALEWLERLATNGAENRALESA
jgi:hypothetical protein